jgi:hypothetical protein
MRDPEFQAWLKLPAGCGYRNTPLWSSVGRRKLDRKLTQLVELYRNANPERREYIYKFFEGKRARLDEMWIYVRRVAILIQSKRDAHWLQRGLAIAAVEGGRVDYRDSIVSLVILRYRAERAGIKTRAFFQEAIRRASPECRAIFRNARDHSKGNVEYTIREMGPPEWALELEQKK